HFKATREALSNPSGKLMPKHFNLIIDKIRNSLEQDLQIDTLAALCGVSGRHLARMFKKTTGRTLGEYIAEERINHAKFLLSQPNILIKEIAYRCGFNSQSSFT